MPRLVFDIETIGEDFDKLDETTQEVLTHWIRKDIDNKEEYEKELSDLKDGLGFSPLTGEVVVIGVFDYEREQGAIYFQAPGKKIEDFEKDGIKFKQMTEPEMLEKFWELAIKYDEFISFNGRGFDVPFLMIRSAIHGIRPSKDLLYNRYLNLQKFNAKHIDLYEQLTFYGATRKKGGLHLWSRAFGIKSPKSEGVKGEDVTRMFREGKFKEIAEYNSHDIIATKELYDYWDEYLKF